MYLACHWSRAENWGALVKEEEGIHLYGWISWEISTWYTHSGLMPGEGQAFGDGLPVHDPNSSELLHRYMIHH